MIYGVLDINTGAGWRHGYTIRIGKWKFSTFDRPLEVKSCGATGALSPRIFKELKAKYEPEEWIQYTRLHSSKTKTVVAMSPPFYQGYVQ